MLCTLSSSQCRQHSRMFWLWLSSYTRRAGTGCNARIASVRAHCLMQGKWPRKNTNILAHGLPEGFELPRCSNDCDHLLPHTRLGQQCQHIIVMCRNHSNLPQQIMLTDPMIKGKLPHGLLRHLDHTHRAWLKHTPHMHDALVDCAVSAFVECIPLLPSIEAYANANEVEAASHNEDSDDEHDATSESESPAASDDDAVNEADYDADGLHTEKVSKVLRPDPPTYKTQPTKVHRHTHFIPGRDERCELDTIELWELSFWDIIEIDFKDHTASTCSCWAATRHLAGYASKHCSARTRPATSLMRWQ